MSSWPLEPVYRCFRCHFVCLPLLSRLSCLQLIPYAKFVGVFYLKKVDFDTRRQGITRDEGRRSQSRIENELEQNQMIQLRKELEKDQKVKPST